MYSRKSIAVLAAVLASPAELSAQVWPAKQPIKIISPFTPGAAPESLGRPIFEHVSKQLGQTVIWESRAGAGGTIGVGVVAKADPDGYTLLVNSSSHTVAPSLYSNLRYDTVRDLAAISPLGELPVALIVPPARHQTLAAMVSAGRAKPGSLTYASAGVGSGSHLIAEKFRLAAGLEAAHAPFKGAPDTIRVIVANSLDFAFAPLGQALPLIESRQVRGLAVSGTKRAALRSDLPTTVEAGYPGSASVFWIGAFAPSGTPKEIIQRLHGAIAAAVVDPGVRDVLTKLGAEPMPQTPAEFDAFVAAEIESNAKLIKAAGIKPN